MHQFNEQYKPCYLKNNRGQKSIDFLLSEFNVVIECQGIQHFKPIKYWRDKEWFKTQLKNDMMKKLLVETNENIKMFYFVDEHVKLTSILNQDIYNNIYNKNNTFKSINKLFRAIMLWQEQINQKNIYKRLN